MKIILYNSINSALLLQIYNLIMVNITMKSLLIKWDNLLRWDG